MKKIALIIVIFIVTITLSGCVQRPFLGPSGTEFIQDNEMSYSYYNGSISTTLFRYEFSKDYLFFQGEDTLNYIFTRINNYEEISEEFIVFLDSFDYVYYDRIETEEDYDNLELSTNASENNYNLVKVPVDDKVYDTDAYITTSTGVRIIFSYTEFYSDGELILVPYHIGFVVYEIFEQVSQIRLYEDNDYADTFVKQVNYNGIILPLPTVVTEATRVYNGEINVPEKDFYTKYFIGSETTKNSNDVAFCDDTTDIDCIEREYIIPKMVAFNNTEEEIVALYKELFNGRIVNEDLIVSCNGYDFIITFFEVSTATSDIGANPIGINFELYIG